MVINPAPPCTCSPENSDLQELILSGYANLPAGQMAAGLSVGVISGVDELGEPIITRCYSGYANLQNQTLVAQETAFEIAPLALTKAVTDPDRAAAKRAFDAMMQMKKIDVAAIETARRG